VGNLLRDLLALGCRRLIRLHSIVEVKRKVLYAEVLRLIENGNGFGPRRVTREVGSIYRPQPFRRSISRKAARESTESSYPSPLDLIKENTLPGRVIERPTKQAIREMPLFDGMSIEQIIIVEDAHSLTRAKNALAGQPVLGFDTESKPTFKPGEKSKGPHLIQFSTEDQAVLIPIGYQDGVDYALSIIEDAGVMKVGFGLSGDGKLFRNKFGVSLRNTMDLCQKLKNKYHFEQPVGAKAAVALVFGRRLSKSAQRSNWAVWPLDEHQIKYAANDAYSAVVVHQQVFAVVCDKLTSDKAGLREDGLAWLRRLRRSLSMKL